VQVFQLKFRAAGMGGQITIMFAANTVAAAHRGVRRTHARQARNGVFQKAGVVAKIFATGAACGVDDSHHVL